jgi:uncharacterized RDD family membrane protein YckC
VHIYTCTASTHGGRETLAPPTEPQTETIPSVAYASWGRRFVAWLLDSAIVWFTVAGIALAAAVGVGDSDGLFGALVFVAVAIFAPLYWVFLHASERGQTLGKRAVGIAVRDESTLGRITFGRALGRAYIIWFLLSMFYIPWILDSLWPLWDAKRQTWHDKVAESVVVRVHTSETPSTLLILCCQLLVAAALLATAIGGLAWGLPRLGSGPDHGPKADIDGVVGAWNGNSNQNRVFVARYADLECVVELSPTDPTKAKITVVSSTGYWGQFRFRYAYNGSTASRSGFHSWFVYDQIYGPFRRGHDYDTALRGMTWRAFKAKSGVDCKMGSDGAISTPGSH